ncbi:MAG: hypothetical protein ACRCX2_18540 [Paraclostridium sp.]
MCLKQMSIKMEERSIRFENPENFASDLYAASISDEELGLNKGLRNENPPAIYDVREFSEVYLGVEL